MTTGRLPQPLDCPVATFPESYLGLPLMQKAPNRGTRCARRSRRPVHPQLTLTNDVLMAQVTCAAATIKLPKVTITRIDKPRRGML